MVEFNITKQKETSLGWEEIIEFSTTSIQTICDLYAKLHEDEALVIKYLDKDRIVILVLNKEKITILIGGDFRGKRKTKDIKNLYDFLSILYAEQNLGGLKCLDVLFERYER